jgi:VanZ family protein
MVGLEFRKIKGPLNSSQAKIWKAWLPAFIWLGLIAIESTSLLSSENTSRILYPICHFLTGVDWIRFAVWNNYIRKAGHVVGYFTLSFLVFGAWRATLPIVNARSWSIQWARIAFLMTALVASLDEWHQTYLMSRTGNFHDVVLDSSAAGLAQIAIFVWYAVRRPRPPGAPAAMTTKESFTG